MCCSYISDVGIDRLGYQSTKLDKTEPFCNEPKRAATVIELASLTAINQLLLGQINVLVVAGGGAGTHIEAVLNGHSTLYCGHHRKRIARITSLLVFRFGHFAIVSPVKVLGQTAGQKSAVRQIFIRLPSFTNQFVVLAGFFTSFDWCN